jgi:hypothetical protein
MPSIPARRRLSSGSLLEFRQALSPGDQSRVAALDTPYKIQRFIDEIPYSPEERYRSPLSVLRDHKAHCFDGALLGATLLRSLGHVPRVLEMVPENDDDHMLAVFQVGGLWGALAKSNFVGLRYREPIFRTLRELVLSYFEDFFNQLGEKSLRGYTYPVNLALWDRLKWMTSDEHLEELAERIGGLRKVILITPKMARSLSPVDPLSLQAGLLGSDPAGLYQPKKRPEDLPDTKAVTGRSWREPRWADLEMGKKAREQQPGKTLASSGYRPTRLLRKGLTVAFVPALWMLVLWALASDPTVSRSALGPIRIAISACAALSLLVTLAAFLTDLDSRLEVTSHAIVHKLGRPWPRVLEIPFSEIERISLVAGGVRIKRHSGDRWIDLGREWREFPAIEKALRSKLGGKVG